MIGQLAISRAGHDKDVLYLIVREDEKYVYLADGILKTYAAPKKKNKKHIQPIHSGLSEKEMENLAANPADADTKIKRCIKVYERNV
ncbi:MAG: KOW domain-containing RNA-binding protein [Eubacteriales bacterium]|nr:KOW domain-containing RNA-binding protein [Eubacteriales bacterium]